MRAMLADGIKVSLVKLCAWFGVPRRTVYYKPAKAAPKVGSRFAEPIKAVIAENPSFGYRTVAFLLSFNKNTVQRIFQLKHWQVRKRPIGMRPRIQALPSIAIAPNERWSTDLCRIWAGKDGWTSLAQVIDWHTRELLGWHLSRCWTAPGLPEADFRSYAAMPRAYSRAISSRSTNERLRFVGTRTVRAGPVEHHPHRTLAHFRGKRARRLVHDAPSSSGVGASGKPGAVQDVGQIKDFSRRFRASRRRCAGLAQSSRAEPCR
ncbi:hypothetical protein PARHAE_01602 [Paracoccus haematequi]|uniref:HTH-like domain-containing protein n=1 Tax=Paracoccus haematequi TaxID=2491866 RepID=A0A3S4DB15_9RHOB|nr:hypothetical protein [Paracoccus haematequi]VDS08418.1 hypothetical protein PARHAE_01602 [Paracoccus haematequi]